MSKLKSAPEKKDWQKLEPHAQLLSFLFGPVFAKSYAEVELAFQYIGISKELEKRLPTQQIDVFSASKEGSWEQQLQYAMVQMHSLIMECVKKKDATLLRNLAEAIEKLAGDVYDPVDRPRAFLFIQFEPEIQQQPRPVRVPKTFAQIRDAFFLEFPDSSMDDSQLRQMIAEFGVILLPAKRGPKGPRNSGE